MPNCKVQLGTVGAVCKVCKQATPCRHGEAVILNVYDMLRLNDYTKPLGLGVFHTGIEIYGVEYAYAGNGTHYSGIFEINPRASSELGPHFEYQQSIILGMTLSTRAEVRELIHHLGEFFPGHYYHLTNYNCNHFSNTLSQILCGRGIPNWVNRLANLFTNIPVLKRLLPKDMLRPATQSNNRREHDNVLCDYNKDR